MSDKLDRTRFRNAARLHGQRTGERQTDELIGMIRMALSDGCIETHEAEFIRDWLHVNEHARTTWPGTEIYPAVGGALEHGIPPEHEAALLTLFVQAIGDAAPQISAPTTLPLTQPAPDIQFIEREFCFTGDFAFGRRTACESEVEMRGGIVCPRVTARLDYLVIGSKGNPNWRLSNAGSKILSAIKRNAAGASIAIITEDHWVASL